jgi:DNA processing protein
LPDLTHEDSRVVAVVGTRRCTSYGQNKAREIAKDLVEKNIVVVSGMAIGIDSFVHNACVNAGGKTVAVLACGPDIAYPSSNKQLYNRIINEDRGAVVSEYMPGIRPEKWRFPQRNRIVSGMSRAVIVIEAGQESGALITAKIAFEQNRDVFAIPGRTDNLMSMGTNKLIAHTKAHMIRHVGDFMYKMNWIKDKEEEGVYVPTIVELYGREKDLYEYLSNEPLHFDALLAMSNMSVGELSSTLTMLEIAGVVKRDDADFYQRVDLMV